MSGPWEKYQTQAAPAVEGPWTRYANAAPAAVEMPEYDASGSPTGRTMLVQPPAPQSGPDFTEAIGRGALQGATFGGGDEIYAAGKGLVAKARGQDFGPEYERQLAETQEANRAAKEAYPWTYGISEAVGSVPPLLLGGMTTVGGKALGLTGKTLLGRSAAAGVSGAGIGAIQGAASAELGERAEGGLYGAGGGAVIGAASPAIGAAVGRGVGYVSDAIRGRGAGTPAGMSNAATELLAQDVRAAGGAQAVRDRLAELGPEARLLDASPSFQGRAQGLAIQPETREMIVDPLVRRNAGTNARLETDLDSTIGKAPVPSRIEAELAEARKAVDYNAVFRDARAVDTTDLAAKLDTWAIDKRGPAASAAAKVRSYLDIPGNKGTLDPSPAALHETRQAIDGMLDGETNRTVRWVLGEARKGVDSALSKAVPGIKAVDAQYAELARQSEGLKRGSQIFDGGKTAIRPTEFADEFSAAALPQGEMVGPSAVPLRIRQGARGEIDRLVGTHANDLNEMRKLLKGEGDWNLTKLVNAFGSKEGARIWNAVDREAAFREAFQDIVGGSKTAMRTGAAEGTKVRGQSGGGAGAGVAGLAGAVGGPGAAAMAVGAQGVRAGAGQVMKVADLARNRQVASALTMQPGAELDSVIDTLASRIAAQSQSQMTAQQARDLAQIVLMSQGDNAGQGMRRIGGLGGLGGTVLQ